LERLEASIPAFVQLLLTHRSPALHGQRLGDIWPDQERRPARLLRLYQDWRGDLAVMARQPPTLVFAVVGQAKIAGLISPEAESRLLSTLLKAWAVRSSLDVVQRSHSNHAPSVRRAS
jgi:hypothetical protein